MVNNEQKNRYQILGNKYSSSISSYHINFRAGADMTDIEELEKELEELKEEKKTAKQKTDLEKEIKTLKAEKKEREKKPSKSKGGCQIHAEVG